MLQWLRLLRLGAHGVSPVQGLDGERSARALLLRRRLTEPKQLGQPEVMRMQVRELREPRLVGQRAESGLLARRGLAFERGRAWSATSSVLMMSPTSACSVGPHSSNSAACTASMAASEAAAHCSGGSTSMQRRCRRFTPRCIEEAADAMVDLWRLRDAAGPASFSLRASAEKDFRRELWCAGKKSESKRVANRRVSAPSGWSESESKLLTKL